MPNSINRKKLAGAMGAMVVSSLSTSTLATEIDANPFSLTELEQGYQQLAEGSCGEGKCGSEGKCGEKGDDEGKCGEGKCGSDS